MRLVALFIALLVPFLVSADDKANHTDLKALAGTWVAVGGEAKGKEITKDDLPFQWTFKEGGKAVFVDRKRGGESPHTYTIDASKKLKVMDITYEGSLAAMKGTKQFGIYEMKNDKLTICLTFPGATEKDRPKEFHTKAGRVLLMKFERAKASE